MGGANPAQALRCRSGRAGHRIKGGSDVGVIQQNSDVRVVQQNISVLRCHPGVELRANPKSISHRCHLFEVAHVWELTQETIHLPLGCLEGGVAYPARARSCRLGRAGHRIGSDVRVIRKNSDVRNTQRNRDMRLIQHNSFVLRCYPGDNPGANRLIV